MPVKKKKTKSERLALQKEEQKKILQEEYLRKQAEEELRLKAEAYDKKTEEERKNVEITIKQTEYVELLSQFKKLDDLYQEKVYSLWEKENWNRYFVMGRDLNPLLLQEVNAYLSTWDDDDDYQIMKVFSECHKCLKMIAEIKSAFMEYSELDSKTLRSWKESVHNFQDMIRRKIDVATFILLRGANDHQNEESYNMEYGITDNEEADSSKFPDITMCLWGNLSKNMRHNGMDLSSLGYSFELPSELVMKDCAVRILHTTFDNITPSFLDTDVVIKKSIGNQQIIVLQEPHIEEIAKPEVKDTSDGVLQEKSALRHWKNLALKARQISSLMGAEDVPIEEKNSSDMMFTPPEEPEITIVNEEEYFTVGGIYHFNLFCLPTPTLKTGCWVFTYCEEKVLQHIPYKTSIIPIRHPKPDMSPAVAAEFADSEIKRFEKEMCNAISVCFKLPQNVLFLEQPLPAFWVSDLKGFTTIGFFDTKHEEESGRIFFKTNRFGIITLLQRKYANMPYQSWELTCGEEADTATLLITGIHIVLKIKISELGCCIVRIEQDDKSLFSEVYSQWMNPSKLVKKLLSVGINIDVGNGFEDYIEIPPKSAEMEIWTYSSMSLLSHTCNFSWSRWNSMTSAEQIVFKFCRVVNGTQEKECHILISPEKATIVNCTETCSQFNDEPVPGQEYCSDIYHLAKKDGLEEFLKKVDNINFEFANNMYLLLDYCKLFSCS